MSNEKHDEFLAWRARLGQPDALPEQGLDDHEGSWERLAERLRKKPRRRLTAYYVAAACLLLALVPTSRLFHSRTAPGVIHAVVRQQPLAEKVSAPTHSAEIRQPGQPGQINQPSHHDQTDQPSQPGQPMTPRAAHSAPHFPSIAGLATHPATIQTPANHPAPAALAPDSSRLIGQLPPPKKQLRIVYFNEINHPPMPARSSASREPGFWRIGMDHYSADAADPDPRLEPLGW